MLNSKILIFSLVSFFFSISILGQNLQSLNVNVKVKITNSLGIKTVEESELRNKENKIEANLGLLKTNNRELLVEYYSRQKRNNNYLNNYQQKEHSIEEFPDFKIFNSNKNELNLLCSKNTNLISIFLPNEELVFAYSKNIIENFNSRDIAITIIY